MNFERLNDIRLYQSLYTFIYVSYLKNIMGQILIASTNMSPFKITSRRCCV